MRFALRDTLRFCVVGDSAIFLDVASGRYLAIAQNHAAAFQRWCAGEPLSQQDLAVLGRLERQGILVGSDQSVPPGRSSVEALDMPETILDTGDDRPTIAMVATALAGRLLWAWRARRWSIARLTRWLERNHISNAVGGSADLSRLKRVVRSFQIADLVLGSHDLCLPRSLALAAACRKRGLPTTLVIAVRPVPFAAHCWVQQGPVILNDHPDRAQLFTPILAA